MTQWSDEIPPLCEVCCRHDALKQYVKAHGNLIAECMFCKSQNVRAVPGSDAALNRLFKALIRFFYSEWEYSTHWGNDGLGSLFYKVNPLLNWRADIDAVVYEGLILGLTDTMHASHAREVSLFAGEDGMLFALREEVASELRKWSRHLRQKNYFEIETEVRDTLVGLQPLITSVIPRGTELARARIGYRSKALNIDTGASFFPRTHYRSLTGKNMGAPPPYKATAGRANREGTSFLYLATDDDTAVAEVRPHPGQIISVAHFANTQRIQVADFGRVTVAECSSNDDDLDRFSLVHSVARAFAEPLPPEDRWKYVLTQLIADTLRRLGYGGIRFGSSIAAGSNVTAFDPALWEETGKSSVIIVKQLTYSFKELPVISDDEEHALDYLKEESPDDV